MGTNNTEPDLEAGFSDGETPCGTPPVQTPPKRPTTPIPVPIAMTATTASRLREFLPITTQKEHFIATTGEALSVGLGLGSAVGIWTAINETLLAATHNPHLANWVSALIISLVLAPLLDKATRLLFGKATTVLRKPRYDAKRTRLLDHLIVITSALAALGPLKGLQRQYGPFHTSLGFEYLVFVVGFAAYSFVRTFLFTVVLGHDYDRETVLCSWRQMPGELVREYFDHFRHVYVLAIEDLRDFLTFATYPYLAALWLAHWDTIDPEGKFAWAAHGLNIVFFFTEFVIIKELTYLVATPCWSPHIPRHHHHSL